MLRLFRRKMISAKKYFRRNHFLEKKISSKIFSGVWLVQKIHQQRKTEYGNCCWNPAAVVGFRQTRFRPESGLPESGECCLIPTIGYQNSGPLTVDSGYQQTPIFTGGRFPQTCGQE
jgi:hypothetical protein